MKQYIVDAKNEELKDVIDQKQDSVKDEKDFEIEIKIKIKSVCDAYVWALRCGVETDLLFVNQSNQHLPISFFFFP